MSQLTFRALQAKHGDAFIIKTDDVSILIDGGPWGVYDDPEDGVLKDQIKQLPNRFGEANTIDLMVLTHIDDDHVVGLMEFARDNHGDNVFADINEVWLNSFSDTFILEAIIAKARAEGEEVDPIVTEALGRILDDQRGDLVPASVSNARELDDLLPDSVDINPEFANGLVMRNKGEAMPQRLIGDLAFHVLGPSSAELERLKQKWMEDLPRVLEREDRAAARLAGARKDYSPANLSSIVTILIASDKKILLTGDARTDKVENWMEDVGILEEGGTLHFNIIKIPHHGSRKNNFPEFYQRVTADHYIFSGSGWHGNPDPNVIKMIADSRAGENYKIHMTYAPELIADHDDMKDKDKSDDFLEVCASLPDDCLQFPDTDPDLGAEFLDIVLEY